MFLWASRALFAIIVVRMILLSFSGGGYVGLADIAVVIAWIVTQTLYLLSLKLRLETKMKDHARKSGGAA